MDQQEEAVAEVFTAKYDEAKIVNVNNLIKKKKKEGKENENDNNLAIGSKKVEEKVHSQLSTAHKTESKPEIGNIFTKQYREHNSDLSLKEEEDDIHVEKFN